MLPEEFYIDQIFVLWGLNAKLDYQQAFSANDPDPEFFQLHPF